MMLSFSVPSMRPMIEAGVRQRAGENVGDARVKRQTIRALGPRNGKLLARAKGNDWHFAYDLTLWWKSRTPERAKLGDVFRTRQQPILLKPITIEHRQGMPHNIYTGFNSQELAIADGFESADAFRDFFVPNLGDRFDGVMFKW